MCQEPGESTEHLLPGAPNACATGNLHSGKITDPQLHFLICTGLKGKVFHLYDTVGQCLFGSQNTYEGFGFEGLNLLLSFLAEWRSSCSCRLFWGTAAMILNVRKRTYQWSYVLWINHHILGGRVGRGALFRLCSVRCFFGQ